jgi:hypothetical protein
MISSNWGAIRAAADSDKSDEQPDGQSGDREDRIDAMQHCRSLFGRPKI